MFSAQAEAKNRMQEAIVKPQQKPRESNPAGMWRPFVRGLRASISASTRRLNAMAAERAPTIASTIQSSVHQPREVNPPLSRNASIAPVSAKGSANTECSKRIISSVRRRRLMNMP